MKNGLGVSVRSLFLIAASVGASARPWPLCAQAIEQVATPPPNVVLANYDSVPVGPYGGLEGSAYAARISDPSAAWFNPAGLSRETSVQISGSAGVYERTSVSPQALPNRGGSVQQLPNFVGFTFGVGNGLTAGAALLTTNSWTQEIDAELMTSIPTGQERFAYSADSEFSRRVAAIGVGYHLGGAWRIGGGLAFSLMDLRLVQSISDRIADGTGLSTLLVTTRASGSALQLRTQAGVQYDTQQVRLGAAIRTPGLTMRRSGAVTLDGTLDTGASSLGASVFDTDAHLRYHLPWEIQAGAAYVRDQVEIEVDVQYYSPISAYSLLETDQPTLIYGDTGAGGPPTVITRPPSGLTSVSDPVANIVVGGHFRPTPVRGLRIHGGFATSGSPVGAADEVFNKVDLFSWTVGLSGTWTRFQFSAGLNRRTGTASEVVLRNLLNGDQVRSNINVRLTGFIYSLAYQF